MKANFIFSLCMFSLFFLSCSKDTALHMDATEDLVVTSLKGGVPKVLVCHFDEDTREFQTLSISSNALEKHLNHGDYEGACSTSVIYDFNSCTTEEFVTVFGSTSINQDGLSGCGVELNFSRLETIKKFGYGTYEMDARPISSVSNQYLRLFIDDPRGTQGIDLGIQADGTDDEGLDLIVNGVRLAQGRREMPVSYPNWYHVKLKVTPDIIQLWVDGNLLIEAYDYGGMPIEEGYWGIQSYSTSHFDNLIYTPL